MQSVAMDGGEACIAEDITRVLEICYQYSDIGQEFFLIRIQVDYFQWGNPLAASEAGCVG